MPTTVRADTLRRAARLLGSSDALARKLGLGSSQLERWFNGEDIVPVDVFLRTVDFIEEYSPPEDEKRGLPEGNDTQHGQG